MLQQLEIQNIALIDKVSIEFGEGLNILTGETGAGKSIIIDSINAILGERVLKELIRTGQEKAVIEAVFKINNDKLKDAFNNYGIESEDDGTIIVSREFSLSGKTICRINGKMVTVSVLKEIGQRIIDVHGQYDNQSLLRVDSHIELLDSFGGEKIKTIKDEYTQFLSSYKEVKARLKELSGDSGERERRIDLLSFQIDEIEKSKIKIGEDEDLEKQKLLLSNSEKIISVLSSSYELLLSGNDISSSASDLISQSLSEFKGISKLNDSFSDISKKLEDLNYQLKDVSEEVRNERDCVEYNPALLENVEERIDLIFRLKRKYGNTIDDILNYCEKAKEEYAKIEGSERIIKDLSEQLETSSKKMYNAAKDINKERKISALILESKISKELEDLDMKKTQFKVEIKFDVSSNISNRRKFNENGLDDVEFLISPNVGEPLKSLSKIASGGEMSRIMLAIKTILANVDEMPTLIFDEIDSGVSGRTAQRVGEKLSYISKNHQVICVTHLAQIASMADTHFLIEKISDDSNTYTKVKRLNIEEKKNEIARILGGVDISPITLEHADEMLRSAQQNKNNNKHKIELHSI